MFSKMRNPECWVSILSITLLFVATVLFRPILPIDETRYLSVAWEMFLRGDWLAPLTVNFQPYHHKPPLLFWLINSSWSVFGISRWAATLPVVVASALCLVLTRNMAATIFNENAAVKSKAVLIMLGSVPFLIYGQLIMFDITLTVFVLFALLSLLAFAKTGRLHNIIFVAFFLGLGVLTKGPVAWLYVIFPVLLGPLWLPVKMRNIKWYGSCVTAFILSVIPVLFWLVPVLSQADGEFAYWLLWEQTAGRVTGSFGAAHVRPIWFYLPIVPIMLMPWVLFPAFWRDTRTIQTSYKDSWALRFLAAWAIPVFIAFSFIGGKQPHYLVPLLPAITIMIAYILPLPTKTIARTALSLVVVLFIGQGIASQTYLKDFDLQPVADYVSQYKERDMAFVRKYHGEVTYLGRLEHTVDSEQLETIDKWFGAHPDGMAIIRYKNEQQVAAYHKLFDMPYRKKYLGVFERP